MSKDVRRKLCRQPGCKRVAEDGLVGYCNRGTCGIKPVRPNNVISEVDQRAFNTIRHRLSRCPVWCFCSTKKVELQEYVPSASTEAREMQHVKYQQVRRFSLEPFCPLINHLCPPFDYDPKNLFSPSTSLYMITIEDTRFLEVIHELD